MALDFWDSLFDVDGDGKITDFDFDLDYFLYNQVMNDKNKNVNVGASGNDYSWRELVEDGSEYGLYPEDFEWEYDYLTALEDAKEAEEAADSDEMYYDDVSEPSVTETELKSEPIPEKFDYPVLDTNRYTKKEYKSKRGNMLVELAIAAFVALLAGVIPGGFAIFLIVSTLKEGTFSSAILIFALMLLAFACWMMYKVAGDEVSKTLDSYNKYVEKYEEYKRSIEKSGRGRNTKDDSHVSAASILIPVVLVLIICGVCLLPSIYKEYHENKTVIAGSDYKTAVNLALGDDYEKALDEFRTISKKDGDYKDTAAFIDYCETKKAYYGDGTGLTFYLSHLENRTFRYTTAEQNKQIQKFIALAKVKSDELSAKSKADIESVESASNKNAVGFINAPYVGLSEDRLKDTVLEQSDYYKKEIVSRTENSTVYQYSLFGTLCYKVVCADGVVTEVVDYIHESTTRKSNSSSGYSSSSSSSGTTRRYYYEDDPYDVGEYADAEEFYYWHEDDFADYEDAEDYYNDNY